MKYGVLIFNDEVAVTFNHEKTAEEVFNKHHKDNDKVVTVIEFSNNTKARNFKKAFDNDCFTEEQEELFENAEIYWRPKNVISRIKKEFPNYKGKSDNAIIVKEELRESREVKLTPGGQTIEEIDRIIKKCYMLSDDARSRLIGINNEENEEESNDYKVTYIDLKKFGGNR